VNVPPGARVSVSVFDLQGRLLRRLGSPAVERGDVRWDGRDHLGKFVGAGIYFMRVGVQDHEMKIFSRKVQILR
jgi:hypothetical protein